MAKCTSCVPEREKAEKVGLTGAAGVRQASSLRSSTPPPRPSTPPSIDWKNALGEARAMQSATPPPSPSRWPFTARSSDSTPSSQLQSECPGKSCKLSALGSVSFPWTDCLVAVRAVYSQGFGALQTSEVAILSWLQAICCKHCFHHRVRPASTEFRTEQVHQDCTHTCLVSGRRNVVCRRKWLLSRHSALGRRVGGKPRSPPLAQFTGAVCCH